MLKPIFAARTTAQWIADLEAANVPCGPINRVDQVFADPQAIARGLTVADAACGGGRDATGRQSAAPVGARRPNTAARRRCWASTPRRCLTSLLGLPAEEVASLREAGVV